MHIIFGYISNWHVPLLKLLSLLKFKVYYLYIEEKTKLKKEEIASKLKKNNIYPLPIEFEKKISPELNYSLCDPEEFTYKKNIKIAPDKIIRKYCDLFSINKEKIIKIRLLIQDFIGNKQLEVGSILATWSALYESKKILYVSFKFTCFYIPDTKNNVSKIIIPIDLFNYLGKIIKKIFLTFFNFKNNEGEYLKNLNLNQKCNKKHENKKVAFVVHKGLVYGSKDHIIFEKSLYYTSDKNSCFNKYNILHLDYENFLSSDQNLLWFCLKKEKTSNTQIFLKVLLASVKTLYLIKNWSQFLGWLLCMQQYSRYLRYCEVVKKFKNLKLALIDYDYLCPKTLLLAFEKNNIKTAATQERFITIFKPIFYNIMLDTYFVASEYVVNFLKQSKFHDIKNIISVGQYRSDYISLCKKIVPEEIQEAKNKGKKIVVALGFHTTENWFESYITPTTNWAAQINFLEDIIKLSKLLNNVFIVLRYKELDWVNNEYFNEIINKIINCENIIISKNYSEDRHSYKLCANANLIIAKHTSLGDECLANGIPVLFHEYTHNTKKYISDAFDYLSSEIMCYNFEELLEKSKSLLFNSSSKLKDEISKLNKTIYYVKERGNIKNKIIEQVERLVNST